MFEDYTHGCYEEERFRLKSDWAEDLEEAEAWADQLEEMGFDVVDIIEGDGGYRILYVQEVNDEG